MHRFFRLCHTIEGRIPLTAKAEGNLESNLRKNIKDLEKAQLEPLVRFLHLVLDKLFMLLVKPTNFSKTAGKLYLNLYFLDSLMPLVSLYTEAVAQRCPVKKMFLEISQNSQENTCARVSFLIRLQAGLNFIKKRDSDTGVFL